jgi:hypothetical protein
LSHTIRFVNLGNSALAQVTIPNYVNGGETFTLAEFGITGSLINVYFVGIVDRTGTPAPYFPFLVGASLHLLNRPGTDLTNEIATTNGLNFTFLALVQGT